jgi:tetratricopeptide (TPR) repeat protein
MSRKVSTWRTCLHYNEQIGLVSFCAFCESEMRFFTLFFMTFVVSVWAVDKTFCDDPRELKLLLNSDNLHRRKFELNEPLESTSENYNAALVYFRSVVEIVSNDLINRLEKNFDDERPDGVYLYEHWLELKLNELPIDSVRDYIGGFDLQLNALCMIPTKAKCQWQVETTTDRLFLGYFELSQFYVLNSLLNLKARYHLTHRDFPAAIKAIRASLILAKNLGKGATETYLLRGIACALQTLDTIELMMQLPGCPDLQNVLEEYSEPMFDLQGSLEHQRQLFDSALPGLKKLTKSNWDSAGLVEVTSTLKKYESFHFQEDWEFRREWAVVGQAEGSRKILNADGSPVGRYNDLSDFDVVLVRYYREFNESQEQYFDAFGKSYRQSYPEVKKHEENFRASFIRFDMVLTGNEISRADMSVDHLELWSCILDLQDRIAKLHLINNIRAMTSIDGAGVFQKPALIQMVDSTFADQLVASQANDMIIIATRPEKNYEHKPIGDSYHVTFEMVK